MENAPAIKTDRVLCIYFKLARGDSFTKKELAQQFQVTERSIQRDLGALRCFLDEQNTGQEIIYDKETHRYHIQDTLRQTLNNREILAVCKILLESRSLRKDEFLPILDKLISCCVSNQNKKAVQELIANEKYHYIEPRHNKKILDSLWDIGQAVREARYIEIDYYRMKDKEIVHRKVKPVAIMFSEYYFYLTAFIDDEKVRKDFDEMDDFFPTIYRIDRIKSFKVLEERFYIPYKSRFEEGEFRKRIQFMYGGNLRKVKFKYSGLDIDAVLDRLPTAKILDEDNGIYTVSAEVFGNGIEMWIKGQGNVITDVRY